MKTIVCFIDDLCLGGAQRQLVGLAGLLKSTGYEVRFCTYHNNGFYVDAITEQNISYDYMTTMESSFKRIPEFVRYLNKVSPDVVISYIESPCIISCIAKIVNSRFKLIVSERNTSQKNGFNERVRFNLFRIADYIVPNSFSQEKFIKANYSFLNPKVRTITNFVDTNKFIPTTQKPNNTIVSVGRISPQKNILNYLRAIKLVKDRGLKVRFEWYGDTDNAEYQKNCVDLIDHLGLEDYFRFYPAVKNILPIYQGALALCLPSIYEGFPNVICEAMSCGLPILCSNVCDNPDIVGECINGFLFNPDNIEEMASAINRLCSMDNAILLDIKENNRDKAVNEFSAHNFLRKYQAIIED